MKLTTNAQVFAQWSSFLEVVAGFWHTTWVVGVGCCQADSWGRQSSR